MIFDVTTPGCIEVDEMRHRNMCTPFSRRDVLPSQVVGDITTIRGIVTS